MILDSDKTLQSLWYATPQNEMGLFSLQWNNTDANSNSVPIALKSMPPANSGAINK